MRKSTDRMCLRILPQGIVRSPAKSEYYLRSPLESDGRKIVLLHKKAYGIDRFRGCLDLTKIHRTACPVAWKGQFEGKAGLYQITIYGFGIVHLAFQDC